MSQAAPTIPEKLFFKIGEVCEIAGVQAHVLRYWETEFPMLQPQKNRAGQRTYRRRDVEMALRIKELLYDEQYTIAGAKRKLSSDLRGPNRDGLPSSPAKAPARSLRPPPSLAGRLTPAQPVTSDAKSAGGQSAALTQIAKQLQEILNLLDAGDARVEPKRTKPKH